MPRQFCTGSHTLVRELNRSIILNQLWIDPLSLADLAVRSRLNKTTVSSLVDELIDYGLVREPSPALSAGGRPAVQRVERTGTNGLFWTSSVNSTSADEAGTKPRF